MTDCVCPFQRARKPLTGLATVVLVLALTSCGGGGAGGSEPAPAPPPAGPSQPTMTLLAGTGRLETPGELGQVTMSSISHALNAGQLAVDLVQRFLTQPPVASQLVIKCPLSGTASLTLDDRDGNGRSSANDVITARFADCGYPLMQRVLDGQMAVKLDAFDTTTSTGTLVAQVTFESALGLKPFPYPTASGWRPAEIRGSFTVNWSRDDAGTRLQLKSSSADDLRFENYQPDSIILEPASMRQVDIVKSVRFDDARISTTANLILGSTGGRRAVVSTISPLTSELTGPLLSGQVAVNGAGGLTLFISPFVDFFLPSWRNDLKNEQGALLESRNSLIHLEHNSLAWGGRQEVGRVYGGTGGGPIIEVPHVLTKLESSDLSGLQSMFRLRQDVDPYLRDVDAIFMHPVGPRTPVTVPGGTVRIQIPTPLAAQQRPISFRFKVSDQSQFTVQRSWTVAARTVRHGALFLLTPEESLLHGEVYEIQASDDGVNWTGSLELKKADGSAYRTDSLMQYLSVQRLLLLDVDPGRISIPAPDKPIVLSATAKTAPDLTFADRLVPAMVQKWRWEQLTGAPLVFGTPDAASTTVAFAAGPMRPADRALVQLTATDVEGRVQRARVLVRAGQFAEAGSLSYTVVYNAPTDQELRWLDRGSVTIRAAPEVQSGAWSATIEDGALLNRTLWLRMPDGGPLRIGRFTDAVALPAGTGRAGIKCIDFGCLTAASSGTLEIRELETAADGTITRLAVDYEWPVPLNPAQTTRGSFRYNSSLPIVP